MKTKSILGAPGPENSSQRAVAAGGKVVPHGEMTDQFWGDRSGSFTDPHGYTWSIATHKEDLTPEEMERRWDAFMKQFATTA